VAAVVLATWMSSSGAVTLDRSHTRGSKTADKSVSLSYLFISPSRSMRARATRAKTPFFTLPLGILHALIRISMSY